MVHLCKFLNNRVCVCCDNVQAVETMDFGVWYRKLFRKDSYQYRVIDTCIMRKNDFRCQGKPTVYSVVQEFPPVVGNVLILVSTFLLVQGECTVWCGKVIPNSLVILMKSVMMKAVLWSWTTD